MRQTCRHPAVLAESGEYECVAYRYRFEPSRVQQVDVCVCVLWCVCVGPELYFVYCSPREVLKSLRHGGGTISSVPGAGHWQPNLLVCLEMALCRGWLRLSKMDRSLSLSCCSATDVRLSSSVPTTALAFLTSLSMSDNNQVPKHVFLLVKKTFLGCASQCPLSFTSCSCLLCFCCLLLWLRRVIILERLQASELLARVQLSCSELQSSPSGSTLRQMTLRPFLDFDLLVNISQTYSKCKWKPGFFMQNVDGVHPQWCCLKCWVKVINNEHN